MTLRRRVTAAEAAREAMMRGQHEQAQRQAHALAAKFAAEIDRIFDTNRTPVPRDRLAACRWGVTHVGWAGPLRLVVDVLEHYHAYDTAAGVAQRITWLESAVFGPGAKPTRTWRNTFGRCLLGMGEYEQVLRTLLPWAYLDDETASYALSILATALRHRGDLESAREHYERAWSIRTRLFPDTHPAVGSLANNIGLLHIHRGDVVAADRYLRVALQAHLATEGADGLSTAATVHHLAVLNEEMIGNHKVALSLLEEALRIQLKRLPPEHPAVETTECNRAVVLMRLGRRHEARDVFAHVLDTCRSRLGQSHPDVATALNNLGWAEQELGHWEQARRQYEDALDLRRRILPAHHPQLARSLHNLAAICCDQGEWEQAQALLRQALDIRTSVLGQQHTATIESYLYMAHVLVSMGQEKEALRLLMRADLADQLNTRQVFAVGSAEQRETFATLTYGRIHALASLAMHRPQLSGAPEALLSALLRKRGVAGHAFRSERAAAAEAGRSDLAELLDERDRVSRRLAQLTFSGPGPLDDPEGHQRAIEDLIGRRSYLEAEFARAMAEGPSRCASEREPPKDPLSLAELLPRGTVYVEFLLADALDYQAVPARGESVYRQSRYLMLIVRPERRGEVECVDLGDADRINRLAALFRTYLSGRLDTVDRVVLSPEAVAIATAEEIERELTERLSKPLLQGVMSARTLLIVPDAELAHLPFAALPDSSGQRLLHRYAITYLASGRDLVDPPSAQIPGTPLVIAAPDFDLTAARHEERSGVFTSPAPSPEPVPRVASAMRSALPWFTPLEGARDEGEAVARLLRTTPLTGAHATKTALQQIRPAPNILHIVTHGYFLPDRDVDPAGFRHRRQAIHPRPPALGAVANPMLQSGLALAGANTWLRGLPLPEDADNGFLTAAEVMTLELRGTELVVLSACDTGLGLRHVAEGSIGLRRSFLLAGAAAVISTLWKIPDQQAAEFMATFYGLLVTGASPAAALRTAQLHHAQSEEEYTWAAFVLYARAEPSAGADG
ncbi:CHAT domain-containing tetratricopeptide repeat protein [Streptomyces xanthophaeus]|uniref:CHAT domain-containing tetratricopeptide repeat protein n=1 Tax=Streptomyces xanthophaeus TaxID=67385 RepID=UPI002647359C|nr:CHAT domain-containing tetratricopeptide repeat protein [Streptomyces xanthophaeus]WKD31227.1 CHAT domain-containing protein [Streptomyces xanthophaeus]